MEIFQYILKVIRQNLLLAIILVVAAITAGFIHSKSQTIRYVSTFTITKGKIDYILLRELAVFNQITSDIYNLEETDLDQISADISDFTISYISASENSLSFTLVTINPDGDHFTVQEAILSLMNSNKFIESAIYEEVNSLIQKRDYLDQKIEQLDSIMIKVGMNGNSDMGDNPLNSYTLYEEKIELEKMIAQSGKFKMIKPILNISPRQRPLILFLLLYMVIAGITFLLFSKKRSLK